MKLNLNYWKNYKKLLVVYIFRAPKPNPTKKAHSREPLNIFKLNQTFGAFWASKAKGVMLYIKLGYGPTQEKAKEELKIKSAAIKVCPQKGMNLKW